MAAPPERIEHSIVIRAAPERVFDILTDPNYAPRYTAGVETAELVAPGPGGGLVGTRLELGTASGRTFGAIVTDFQPGRRLAIEDDNGVSSTWSVEPTDDGRVRLRNVLVGHIPVARANKLRYAADLKFQAIARLLEEAPGGEGASASKPQRATGGAAHTTGTARTPRQA